MKKIFKGKKVVVMGLGLLGGGVGVAKFFVKQGAKVLVTDLKAKSQLKESIEKLKPFTSQGLKKKRINYVLGKHRPEDFTNADLIIKNPAVPQNSPYLKIARDHKIPIKTDIGIFFDLCPAEIIGVTGTKGKSTTATLIYLFLKKKYPKTFLAGNIGLTPLEILPKLTKNSKVVLELSSFELEDLKKSPHIAVITTLFPDHLNRYKSFNDYVEAKKSIFKHQNKNDILILNNDNPKTRKLAKEARSKVYFFSPLDRKIFPPGLNSLNISAAIKVAEIFKVSRKDIEKILQKFKGVPHRQELIFEKNGVKYISDTAATNPHSTILAIDTFKKNFPAAKIILIAGGQDKNLNYQNLAKEIQKKINYLILLPGTASSKIAKEISAIKTSEVEPPKFRTKVFYVKSMREAVKTAASKAKKDDIVLLSPGAASFNLFKNEFDRGGQFVKAVKEL